MNELIIITDNNADISWQSSQTTDLLDLIDIQALIAEGETSQQRQVNGKHLQVSVIAYQQNQWLISIRDITPWQKLEKIRQDFIANVSHELRTPLTVFRGYLETLLEETNDHPWHPIFQQMGKESERMQKLVADLLLLARLESDQTSDDARPTVEIAPMIRQIHEAAKTLSHDRQHQFVLNLDEGITIHGNEHELQSAFSNLIFNAVHYTPEQGTIEISWQGHGNNQAEFKVTDSGIGIDAKHLARLTERFYRVDKARSRAKGGTGLGLAITKHVLLRHHSELNIESEVGSGSSFSCVFDI